MIDASVLIALIIGTAIGFSAAWFLRSREIQAERNRREELKSEIEQFDNRFKAIAGDVLRTHSKDFLDEFEKAQKQNDVSLDNREKSFQKTVEGLSQSVEAVKSKVAEFETQRAEQLGALGESIKNVLTTGSRMQETAISLTAVLSSASGVRGRWGEAVLRTLLQECGLTEGLDFFFQETIAGEENLLRPDFIINLPGGLQLAVDSKAGLEEFFKAVEEKDPEKKQEHVAQFAQNLRTHIRALSVKEYQKHLDGRMPYVVMFIPGEAAIRAAFEFDQELYRDAQDKRVMLASPATIMPLILLIAHAWKQFKSEQNAVRLVSEVNTLGERLRTFVGHFAGIGSALSQATNKFNSAAGSWDSRVHPQLERISGLGGSLHVDSSVTQIEVEPRLPNKSTQPAPGEK